MPRPSPTGGPDPAGDAQPARPRRRGDRHRQDQDPPADRRAAQRERRAGLRRRHQGRPVRAGHARGGRREDHRPGGVGGPGLGGDRLPGRVLRPGRPGHRHPAAGRPCRRSARRCSARCSASTTPRSPAWAWSSTTPTRRACRCWTSPTCARSSQYLTRDEGKPELKDLGGLSAATAGVILRELIAFSEAQGADAFFGEPEFESADLLQLTPDGTGVISPGRAAQPPGPAGDLLDLPDVAAGRPLPRPARGRRRRPAQAGVLLRRGAPALPRRLRRRSSTRSPRRCG